MGNFNIENENSGLLFPVNSDSDKAPDYSGGINVDGEQYDIALWTKEFKSGEGFTVKISPPYGGGGESNSKPSPVKARQKPTRS